MYRFVDFLTEENGLFCVDGRRPKFSRASVDCGRSNDHFDEHGSQRSVEHFDDEAIDKVPDTATLTSRDSNSFAMMNGARIEQMVPSEIREAIF